MFEALPLHPVEMRQVQQRRGLPGLHAVQQVLLFVGQGMAVEQQRVEVAGGQGRCLPPVGVDRDTTPVWQSLKPGRSRCRPGQFGHQALQIVSGRQVGQARLAWCPAWQRVLVAVARAAAGCDQRQRSAGHGVQQPQLEAVGEGEGQRRCVLPDRLQQALAVLDAAAFVTTSAPALVGPTIGELDDVYYAFLRAGWDETETIYGGSGLKTLASFFSGGEYRYSPVSGLYVFGRPQDIALQKARDNIHERNHLRLWLAPVRYLTANCPTVCRSRRSYRCPASRWQKCPRPLRSSRLIAATSACWPVGSHLPGRGGARRSRRRSPNRS